MLKTAAFTVQNGQNAENSKADLKKNEIGSPFRGSLSHFFVGAVLQQPLLYGKRFNMNSRRCLIRT
jgi:hypothetical protein